MATTAKRFAFAITVDGAGAAHSDRGGDPLPRDDAWTGEHLVLAALARCTLTSLEHHARRANLGVTGTAEASGVVTKREEDGRYAFVEVDIAVDAVLDPPLAGDELRELLAKAERDCFIGASLTAHPHYRWTIEGEETA